MCSVNFHAYLLRTSEQKVEYKQEFPTILVFGWFQYKNNLTALHVTTYAVSYETLQS